MHVFVDTNILLSFYHYSNDELDSLNEVFTDHEHGAATVYVTEQVKDEFVRNRDGKIKDALKKFNNSRLHPQFPSFMKGYEEYKRLQEIAKEARQVSKSILSKINEAIANEELPADKLTAKIFKDSDCKKVTAKHMEAANVRLARGNPPGKKGRSLGDAINWEILTENVPDKNDIHIISADGDYYSVLDENKPNAFLIKEWKQKKNGNVFVYRTLSEFTNKHFDGIAFSYDKEKQELIEQLSSSGSFAQTHNIIEKLDKYSYFSLKEIIEVLDAAESNSQFGSIVTDFDISDLLHQHAVPRFADIKKDSHRELLRKVIEEQENR
ncbi:MAG: PIN domain-containing protein [Candidatus Electrothrix sp. YB6]